MVDVDKAITAWHVVRCSSDSIVIVYLDSGKAVKARVKRVDIRGDLAVLKLHTEVGIELATIAPPPPARSRVCMAMGSPRRGRLCGRVVKFDHDRNAGNMEHSIPTISGNSGSGIYDGRGRLVAIATHMVRRGDGEIYGGLASSLWKSKWLLDDVGILDLIFGLKD